MIEPDFIIKTLGVIGVAGAVFAESGLLVGIFLPGDSLLFTAGFLASQGYLNIWVLLFATFFSAILGDSVGYFLGRRFGSSIFKGKRFLTKEHLEKSEKFFSRFGARTIVLARFVPIIRTLAPIMAGVSNMRYRTFFFYNIFGAFIWVFGITMFGYVLGSSIPGVSEYLDLIILLIIIISLLPVFYEFYKIKFAKKTSE